MPLLDAKGGMGAAGTVEVYRQPGDFPPELTRLFDAAEQGNHEHGLDWLRLFSTTVMHGSSGARYLALTAGGQTVGAMAVCVDPQLVKFSALVGSMSNYYSSEFKPVLQPWITGADLAPMMRALRIESGKRPSLRFAPMDPLCREYAVLRAGLQTAGYSVFEYLCHGNWYLPVAQNWDEYLARRPGELRSTIKRMRKRLQAEGAKFEIASTPDEAERAVAAFEQVYARSWKKPEPVPQFMAELIRLCARRGWMRLGIVWLGEVPIAAQLWIVSHGRAAIYKLAYDEDYKRHAAGTVLTAHLMQHVLDVDRVHEVDYLIGDDPYKRQWMTHRRERWGLVAYDLHTVRGCWGALRQWLADKVRGRKAAPAAGVPGIERGPNEESGNDGCSAPRA